MTEDADTPDEEVQDDSAEPLVLGSKAPTLTDVTWLKHGPRTLVGPRYSVVEFWATWCPPCRDSIPHLTELQHKYHERLQIVGLTNEDRETVEPFLEEMGASMDYSVGLIQEPLYDAYMSGI